MISSRTEAQPHPSSRSPITNRAWMILISGVHGPACSAWGGKEGTWVRAEQAEQTPHRALPGPDTPVSGVSCPRDESLICGPCSIPLGSTIWGGHLEFGGSEEMTTRQGLTASLL